MNHSFHESRDDNDKVEPEELLEDCWFFGNLLERKPRMLRSYSEPCSSSSSNYNQESNLSYEETYDSINKLSLTEDQTPSRSKGSHLQRSKSSIRTSSNALVRAPSLPTTLENQDEEIEFSMGKLIRQASLTHTLPPRKNTHKGVITNSTLSRKKHEQESIKSPIKTQRSLKELESEELQGFKEKELSPNVARVEDNRTARPYLSEAWSAPPVPRWGVKRSTEDMKAQIKFWARAVASNVRQEC
ncbi:hypothetical protein ACS0TY_017109 [Phlomoides rotata]